VPIASRNRFAMLNKIGALGSDTRWFWKSNGLSRLVTPSRNYKIGDKITLYFKNEDMQSAYGRIVGVDSYAFGVNTGVSGNVLNLVGCTATLDDVGIVSGTTALPNDGLFHKLEATLTVDVSASLNYGGLSAAGKSVIITISDILDDRGGYQRFYPVDLPFGHHSALETLTAEGSDIWNAGDLELNNSEDTGANVSCTAGVVYHIEVTHPSNLPSNAFRISNSNGTIANIGGNRLSKTHVVFNADKWAVFTTMGGLNISGTASFTMKTSNSAWIINDTQNDYSKGKAVSDVS
jgi:hypothetical protein